MGVNVNDAFLVALKAEEDARMLSLWDKGFDTFAIAKDAKLPEHIVARKLWRMRQERRAA